MKADNLVEVQNPRAAWKAGQGGKPDPRIVAALLGQAVWAGVSWGYYWGTHKGYQQSVMRSVREAFPEPVTVFESGAVLNAVIAASGQQAEQLWRLRETIPESQKHAGGCIKHDVSVPVSKVAEFIVEGSRRLEERMEGIRVFPFGHVGDGNLHY